MDDFDAIGPEKKKIFINDMVKIVTYINSLEASLDAYEKARRVHNAKFEEKILGKKETSP